jgi:D-alanyl-D-alanine carboxypeptidase (penicillin-binding protein 5/6)
LCVAFLHFPSDLLAAPRRTIKAKSAIVMNADSGKILYKKNPDKSMPPASLTKILTLYIVQEAIKAGKIKPTDSIDISVDAQLTGGSSMYLVDDKEAVLGELIKGIAVVSANDASVAVAEHLGGTSEKFVEMMNAKARKLGMKHSRFINPHGLPAAGQVSTARDILMLSRAYIRDFPEALRIHSLPEYTYGDITQQNSNTLITHNSDVDGLKTGFVRASGFHLVATAKRENIRLIAVVMGEKNIKIREKEAMQLLEDGFRKSTKRVKVLRRDKK